MSEFDFDATWERLYSITETETARVAALPLRERRAAPSGFGPAELDIVEELVAALDAAGLQYFARNVALARGMRRDAALDHVGAVLGTAVDEKKI